MNESAKRMKKKKKKLFSFSLYLFSPPPFSLLFIYCCIPYMIFIHLEWSFHSFSSLFFPPPPHPPPFFTLVYLDCGWITKKAEMVIVIQMKSRLLLKTFMSICENVCIKTHWWGGKNLSASYLAGC